MGRKCRGIGEMARKGRFWHLSEVAVGLLCSGKRDCGGMGLASLSSSRELQLGLKETNYF